MKANYLITIILFVLTQRVIAQEVSEKIDYNTETAIQYYDDEILKDYGCASVLLLLFLWLLVRHCT